MLTDSSLYRESSLTLHLCSSPNGARNQSFMIKYDISIENWNIRVSCSKFNKAILKTIPRLYTNSNIISISFVYKIIGVVYSRRLYSVVFQLLYLTLVIFMQRKKYKHNILTQYESWKKNSLESLNGYTLTSLKNL